MNESNGKIKVYFYVDGFNLYHRSLKETRYKWLNIEKFCELLLPRHEILRVKYFTARITQNPYDPTAHHRQDRYLRVLGTLPKTELIFGNYETKPRPYPLAAGYKFLARFLKEPIRIKIIRPEEKRSDVNLASHLVRDACDQKFEMAAIITGDTDQFGAIQMVKRRGLMLAVINPGLRTPPRSIMQYNNINVRITNWHLENAQFSRTVFTSSGKQIHKPEGW